MISVLFKRILWGTLTLFCSSLDGMACSQNQMPDTAPEAATLIIRKTIFASADQFDKLTTDYPNNQTLLTPPFGYPSLFSLFRLKGSYEISSSDHSGNQDELLYYVPCNKADIYITLLRSLLVIKQRYKWAKDLSDPTAQDRAINKLSLEQQSFFKGWYQRWIQDQNFAFTDTTSKDNSRQEEKTSTLPLLTLYNPSLDVNIMFAYRDKASSNENNEP